MPKVDLVATKDFSYSTRRLKAGVLVAIGKARAGRVPGRAPAPPARVIEQASAQAPADDFLDRAIPAIAKDMPGLDTSELRRHLSAEKRGKGRKGLITAFEAELEARKG
jgi:hypothetical protein